MTTGFNGKSGISTTGNITANNITVTTSLVYANISFTGNVTTAGNISGNYILGNGALLTGITAGSNYSNANVADYLSSGTVASNILTTAKVQANQVVASSVTATGTVTGASLSTAGTVQSATMSASGTVTANNLVALGQVCAVGNVSAANFVGNGRALTGISPSLVFITSNIASIVAGQALNIEAVYGNAQYPGGVFTIYQTPQPRPTITANNFWTSTSAVGKNAYSNYAGNVVNSSSVTLNLGISTPATFAVQFTDSINIGNTIITGTDLIGLGISGTGGRYTIAPSLIGNAQVATVSNVQVNLTTSAGGPYLTNGNTLNTVQPIPFSLNGITASFADTSVTPGLGNSQPVYFNVTAGNGSVITGNIIISGAANLTTNVGNALVGNTGNINSVAGNFVVTASYSGAGLFGAGNSTANVSTTLAQVEQTTPLFYKSTANGNNPNFLPTDTHYETTWVAGPGTPGNAQGITTNTNNPTSQYYWLAVPDSAYWSYGPVTAGSPPNLFYNYALTGLGVVNTFPAAAYGNGTDTFGGSGGSITIGNIPYVALGFTDFANVQSPSNPANLFVWISTSSSS